MRKLYSGVYVVTLFALVQIMGCKKSDSAQTSLPVDTNNKAPIAVAGNDTTIYFPAYDVFLDGGKSYDPDGDSADLKWEWHVVSGPGPTRLYYHDNLWTPVFGLVATGTYKFRLTVRDRKGAYDTDEVEAKVVNPPCESSKMNEIVLKDVEWTHDGEWGVSFLQIDLYAQLPPKSNFKEAYLRRDFSESWIKLELAEIPDINFHSFGFNDGYLYVSPDYRLPLNDTPDLRLVYCN